MTRAMQLTVGPDGRVAIPGAKPGQTVTVEINETAETPENIQTSRPILRDLTAITARIKRRARKMREELPEPWRSSDHGDLLYGDGGLPL